MPIPHIILEDDGLPATRPQMPEGPSWRDQVAAELDAADLLSRGAVQSPDDLPVPVVVDRGPGPEA